MLAGSQNPPGMRTISSNRTPPRFRRGPLPYDQRRRQIRRWLLDFGQKAADHFALLGEVTRRRKLLWHLKRQAKPPAPPCWIDRLRSRWGRRFRLPAEADFNRSSRSRWPRWLSSPVPLAG